MNVSEVLKWLEEESDRLTEESLSSADPHKTVNNSFLEGFNYALANVQGLDQPQLNENQQKTCNLCNEEQKQATLYDSRGRSVAIDGGSLIFVENYREYAGGMLQTQQSSLPINFCPMCGKRLEQGEE